MSGNNTLANQRLGNLSKDKNDLKESLEFSQKDNYDKFKHRADKIEKP